MEENTQVPSPETKSGMNMVLIVVAIAVVLIGGFMLLNRPTTETEESVTETTPATNTESALPTESIVEDVVTIDMEAGSFYYTSKEIRVKKGQSVRINLSAKDMMHDFNIDELNVDGPVIKEGESTVIEFVASEVGSFEYYCSVGQHRANGQVGTLIVEE